MAYFIDEKWQTEYNKRIMSKENFENMLKKHEALESNIDWEKKKQEWLDFVQQFYDKIEQWLKPYVKQKRLRYDYHDISLTEGHIGIYTVKAMNINFAGQQVGFEPIGTSLIGSKGRIDMEGARGIVQFILVDRDSKGVNTSTFIEKEPKNQKQPDWVWKILLKERRQIIYDEFNEGNFFAALMEIVND